MTIGWITFWFCSGTRTTNTLFEFKIYGPLLDCRGRQYFFLSRHLLQAQVGLGTLLPKMTHPGEFHFFYLLFCCTELSLSYGIFHFLWNIPISCYITQLVRIHPYIKRDESSCKQKNTSLIIIIILPPQLIYSKYYITSLMLAPCYRAGRQQHLAYKNLLW